MTCEEYNRLASKFDYTAHRAEQEAAQIPSNINRAGAKYRRLLQDIRLKYEKQ